MCLSTTVKHFIFTYILCTCGSGLNDCIVDITVLCTERVRRELNATTKKSVHFYWFHIRIDQWHTYIYIIVRLLKLEGNSPGQKKIDRFWKSFDHQSILCEVSDNVKLTRRCHKDLSLKLHSNANVSTKFSPVLLCAFSLIFFLLFTFVVVFVRLYLNSKEKKWTQMRQNAIQLLTQLAF